MTETITRKMDGFAIRITPILVEGFLAIYGDRDRFAGDDHLQRRRDVVAAAERLRLVRDPQGAVTISAASSLPATPPSIAGFLEAYEARSDLDGRNLPGHVERLRLALSVFLSRESGSGPF